MNTTSTKAQATIGFTPATWESFLAERDEPKWLQERRRAAFDHFQAAPWPTLRDEAWRRTDIRALKLDRFTPPHMRQITEEERGDLEKAASPLLAHCAGAVQHINGMAAEPSKATALPPGVVFTDLNRALATHPALLERYLLTRVVDPATDAFSALHAAFWSSGTLLYVPRGVQVEAPLAAIATLAGHGSVDLHHLLVILEEGASATLVLETTSPKRATSTPALHAGAVELLVGSGAKLRYISIQDWDNAAWHFSHDRAILDRDASLQWTIAGLGSRLTKVNQEVLLQGPGSRAQVNGVLFASGRQNLTYLTRQEHAAPHTTSDLLYKGGLIDASRVVWKGMIRVDDGAQKTDAYQKNDNLILSENDRADSIPGLEIEANDVRCTHGATAGRVDEEMLFYLQSRGLKRDEATRLVVEGFFANVYDRITLVPMRDAIRSAVAAKLGTKS
jgi:Fe-S cluster assembly protein SufD